MVFCYQIALWVSGECDIVGRTHSLSVHHCWCIQLIISSRSVRGNSKRVEAGDAVQYRPTHKKYSRGRARRGLRSDPPSRGDDSSRWCSSWYRKRAWCVWRLTWRMPLRREQRSCLQVSCGPIGSPLPSRGGESGRSGALPAGVYGTDSHWWDPRLNIALRWVPHDWHPCPGRSDVFAARCCPGFLGIS